MAFCGSCNFSVSSLFIFCRITISSCSLVRRAVHQTIHKTQFAQNSETNGNCSAREKSGKYSYKKFNGHPVQICRLSDNDKIFSQALHIASSRSTRKKKCVFLLETAELIKHAFYCSNKGSVCVQQIFVGQPNSATVDLPLDDMVNSGAKVYHMSSVLQKRALEHGIESSVFAICSNVDVLATDTTARLPITVVCDNIRDPSNMGTIINMSARLRCHQLLATKGCVDVWEPKVLRSASAAHFHIHLTTDVHWDRMSGLLPPNSSVFLADPSTSPRSRLPDSQGLDPSDLLPLVTHDSPNYSTCSHVVFVIGGETEGLAAPAHRRGTARVHIPMMPCIDSLNSAVAGSIILFEIYRQMHVSGAVNVVNGTLTLN